MAIYLNINRLSGKQIINGYVSKPVGAEQIKEELKHLRLPMKENSEKRIQEIILGII